MSPRQTNFLHVNVKQHVCCKISPSMSVTYKGSLNSLPCHLQKGEGKLFIHTQLISLSTISLAHWIYSSTYHWHNITSRRYQHFHWKPTEKKRQKEIRCPLPLPKDRLIHFLSKKRWPKDTGISFTWWLGSLHLIVSGVTDPSETIGIYNQGLCC